MQPVRIGPRTSWKDGNFCGGSGDFGESSFSTSFCASLIEVNFLAALLLFACLFSSKTQELTSKSLSCRSIIERTKLDQQRTFVIFQNTIESGVLECFNDLLFKMHACAFCICCPLMMPYSLRYLPSFTVTEC